MNRTPPGDPIPLSPPAMAAPGQLCSLSSSLPLSTPGVPSPESSTSAEKTPAYPFQISRRKEEPFIPRISVKWPGDWFPAIEGVVLATDPTPSKNKISTEKAIPMPPPLIQWKDYDPRSPRTGQIRAHGIGVSGTIYTIMYDKEREGFRHLVGSCDCCYPHWTIKKAKAASQYCEDHEWRWEGRNERR